MSPSFRVSLVVLFSILLSLALLKPCAAVDPSMDMEGDGHAGSQCVCTTKGCTGTLSASLTGPPVGKAMLDLNLVAASSPASTSPGCFSATGTGGINNNAYAVTFSGQVCTDTAHSVFSVNGTVQIVQHPEVAGLATVGAGNLSAVGALHLPCFPLGKFPFPLATAEMVAGIIGVTGRVALLVP